MSLPPVGHQFLVVGADPELRVTPGGDAVTTFRVKAANRKKDENDQWVDGKVFWARVTCWKELAENVAESVVKGDLVQVEGQIDVEQYTDQNNNPRTVVNIQASDVASSHRFRTMPHGQVRQSNQGNQQGGNQQGNQNNQQGNQQGPPPNQGGNQNYGNQQGGNQNYGNQQNPYNQPSQDDEPPF